MVTITGRASSFLERKKVFDIKSKLNSSLFCSSFFLRLQGQPEQCGCYHLLQSCFSFYVHHLASIFWEWPGAVSCGLPFVTTFSFPLVVFFVLLLALSFSRLILKLSLLCSSVYEVLFALSFSFLSDPCFFFIFIFVNAKAALAYSRNESHRSGCF